MPKENGFHQRRQIPFAKLNDIKDKEKIPIIVAATSEELSQPKNHFINFTKKESEFSRLQLFTKKGKMFAYDDKKATTKVTGLASRSIVFFSKPRQISPLSIMQNEEFFSILKEQANAYLEKVLKVETSDNKDVSYFDDMLNRLYEIIKNTSPAHNEVIHLATMEKDLAEPEVGKNRLTAEFSIWLLTGLRKKIALNNDPWKVELDRVLAVKQRTSRAESYGIDRIAQQALVLYQSRNPEEKTVPKEKVIIVDDHIQAGAAISSAADEIIENDANLLGVVCITAHRNSKFFNIQPDVIAFIERLLPNGPKDIPKLDKVLNLVGLSIKALTNIEGMILISILCDPESQEHKSAFENLLKQSDASGETNYSLFENQKNSLMEEFEKPKVHFENLEKDLLKAINSGRYTVPYEKQVVLSDEEGQKIRKEIDTRAHLPWLLFDFDDTLHHLNDNTFFIFQDIIKKYSGVEIPIEAIKRQRLVLKSVGEYQYQNMLLALIKELNPKALVSFEALTELYKFYKSAEPFIPKMSKEDFLMLRSQYRIGVITDGETFESKLPKIKAFYGIDIDGYVNNGENVLKKPSPQMFHQFCKIYNVEVKPIAYIGDSEILDGGFAKNVNLPFIHVDPMKPKIDMQKIKKELDVIEEQRKRAIKKWEFLRNTLPTRAIKISSQEDKRDLNFK